MALERGGEVGAPSAARTRQLVAFERQPGRIQGLGWYLTGRLALGRVGVVEHCAGGEEQQGQAGVSCCAEGLLVAVILSKLERTPQEGLCVCAG